MARRSLTPEEEAEARAVFMGSLSLSCVQISDGIGIGGTPYVTAGIKMYTLHMGRKGFKDTQSDPWWRRKLIHELTHVWQGQNSAFRFGFMVRSVLCQGRALATTLDRHAAYKYAPGKDWADYNVEQQASIVEDWYKNGSQPTDPLYRYIRDHIRSGRN